MKILRRILLATFLLVGSLTTVVMLSMYWDCGACLKDQDYDFMNKVKSKLRKSGDVLKIEDIHSGKWIKVCATPGGYDDNLAWKRDPSGSGGVKLVVLNDADTYISDAYSDSAIIFHYGKNDEGIEQIEIFKMTADKMTYVPPFEEHGDCVERNSAYLILQEDNPASYLVKIISKD